MENIGNKIEELCKEKNITQKELSKSIEISENTIITWKKGSYPRSDILVKIANFFEVSTDYLLGRENASKVANSLNYEEFGITNISLIEKELIYEFRRADQDNQKKIIDMVKILNK